MKERTWSARPDLRALLCTEIAAVLGAAISAAAAGPLWIGAAGGAVVGLLLFVVRIARLTPWQWVGRTIGRLRHKVHHLDVGEFVDVDSDGQPLGVRVDGHTLVTMVNVWGRPHI
nr:type VII secretion protein EccE [Actinomycetes bacterium]